MEIIEEFRKIIKSELGNTWDIIQREIKEYFNMIDFANINYRKNYRKLIHPQEELLDDPLNIPEIYPLLYEIKESNFTNFDNDSITKNYNHYEHGYYLRDTILPQLDPIVERVESFRIENFNKLTNIQKEIQIISKFVDHNFQDYGLIHYDSYINIINGIAYHEEFYIILPNLLRCVFENLLYDIFQTALDKKHTEFIFLRSQTRARDFSQLIALLNILKDREFKPYHKNSLNQAVIDVLKEIQKFGNWTVHQILRQIDKEFVDQMEQKINRVLEVLLVFYKKIQATKILIEDQTTLDKIKKALNLERKLGKEKEKEEVSVTRWKVIIQEDQIPIDENSIIKSLLPDVADGEVLKLKCGIEDDNWKKPKDNIEELVESLFKDRDYYNYKFAIFSLARVSYAIYLGYLLTNQVRIRYSQYNRDLQTWDWIKDLGMRGYPGYVTGLFKRKKKKINEIIIKFSLSAKILDSQIEELDINLDYKIELVVPNPSENWLGSEYQIKAIVILFRAILENLREKAPNLSTIHLFYAGPTTGAIAIGRQINPRMTPLIQLYEFDRTNFPKYQKSIVIGGKSQ